MPGAAREREAERSLAAAASARRHHNAWSNPTEGVLTTAGIWLYLNAVPLTRRRRAILITVMVLVTLETLWQFSIAQALTYAPSAVNE